MVYFQSLTVLATLGALASAATVDLTREVCTGTSCKAVLLNLQLASNTTLNEPASALFLTGVSDPAGSLIDLNKIQCSYTTQAENAGNGGFFTTNSAARFGTDSVVVNWILCDYNRATPGKN